MIDGKAVRFEVTVTSKFAINSAHTRRGNSCSTSLRTDGQSETASVVGPSIRRKSALSEGRKFLGDAETDEISARSLGRSSDVSSFAGISECINPEVAPRHLAFKTSASSKLQIIPYRARLS